MRPVLAIVLTVLSAASTDANEKPLRIAIAASLKQFASLEAHLQENYRVECVRIDAEKGKQIPDADRLAACDLLLLNHYRTEPTP
jgi:hypothetical protein